MIGNIVYIFYKIATNYITRSIREEYIVFLEVRIKYIVYRSFRGKKNDGGIHSAPRIFKECYCLILKIYCEVILICIIWGNCRIVWMKYDCFKLYYKIYKEDNYFSYYLRYSFLISHGYS